MKKIVITEGLLVRFSQKINRRSIDECWEWKGAKLKSGYGLIGSGQGASNYLAHRVSLTIRIGEIREGFVACHKCDNPSCVNPYHLFEGTLEDNSKDMIAKGRRINHFADRTHCKKGHSLSEETTFATKNAKRACLVCRKISNKANDERRKIKRRSKDGKNERSLRRPARQTLVSQLSHGRTRDEPRLA